MNQALHTALIALVLLTLSGCGQMGPLYLPTEEPVADDSAQVSPDEPVIQQEESGAEPQDDESADEPQ